jgi:Rrf2 family cysteine metabolism transcriptional repressor
MRVSSRGQYGIRALAYLAAHHGEGPINVRTVAEAERLPAKYLEQLLARLRRGGLVRSSRGARGGVVLARDPRTISARQVMMLLEGSLVPSECLQEDLDHESRCVTHELWRRLSESVNEALESYTLADLADRLLARGAPQTDEPGELATVGADAQNGRTDVHA